MASENEKSLIGELTTHLIDIKVALKVIEKSTEEIKELKIKVETLENDNKQVLDELETIGEILEEMATEKENEPENKNQTMVEKMVDKALSIAERNPEAFVKIVSGLGIADKIGPVLEMFAKKG